MAVSALESTARAEILRELELLRALQRRAVEPHKNYKPYKPQDEFHALGARFSERGFFAGNQLGKTLSAAHEVYCHATGDYPEWWQGRRFTKPTVGWIGGDTGETIRDTSQRLLFDRPGKLADAGSGYIGIIPQRLVVDQPRLASGIPGLFDHIKVRHISGGVSYIFFKSYSKGRQKWQGDTIDWLWFDEEPPYDIYSEGLTRTNKGQKGQFVFLTFTPLLGMSDVVHKFLKDPNPMQVVTRMTIHDVEHYSDDEKQAIIASYPKHERDARANGVPIQGSGRIFVGVSQEDIEEPHILKIPDWWRHIGGLDFGWDHPTAAVHLLHDPDSDVIHVRKCHRAREATPIVFASGVTSWPKIPFAWPHDGLQHDKGSGEQLAKQYKDAGFDMLPERATFEDGSHGVEAGVTKMLTRMQNGTWRVDSSLTDWFDEFLMYHRKDGVIVKEKDDIMAASRYAMMMLRHAKPMHEIVRKEEPTWRARLAANIRGNSANTSHMAA